MQRETDIRDRSVRLSFVAETRLQGPFSLAMPTFDAILDRTEFVLRGDDAYLEVDEHVLARVLDHFIRLASAASAAAPSGATTPAVGVPRGRVLTPGEQARGKRRRGAPRGHSAPRGRNQDLLMIGVTVDKLERSGVTRYVVTGVDTTQACAYETTVVLTGQAGVNVDLNPARRKGAEDELVARGQWRPLPGQKSFVPHSRHSYVCVDCYAESTCYPCACCEGRHAPGHAMVLSGAGGAG